MNILDQESISALSIKIRRDSAIVKNPGFPFHHEEIMAELFSRYETDLKDAIGFDYDNILETIRAIPDVVTDRMSRAYIEIRTKIDQQVKDIKYYRRKNKLRVGSLLSEESILNYRTISNDNLHKITELVNVDLYVDNTIEKYQFDSELLGDYVGISVEMVDTILRTFSVGNGDWSHYPDPSYGIIPFVEFPYLKINSGFIIPSFRNITWAASIKIEKVLKNCLNNRRLEKYKNYKHDFLLSKSLSYLKELMFDLDFIHENCFYTIDDDRYEVDAMLKVDTTLLVIEFKSHDISDSARTGYEKRVKKHIGDIISHAYMQAVRAIDYIYSNETSEFELKDGKVFQIANKEFDRIIPVSITLAQLGHITAGLKKKEDSNYFENSLYPWIVNIYDLKIVCDLCRNSSELIDYVTERELFLEETKMSVYDELDIFSYYQNRTLNSFRNMPDYDSFDWGYLENATDDINQYYFNQYGDYYDYIDKPQLKLSKPIELFVTSMLKNKLVNRIDLCLHLYSIDRESIERFSKNLHNIVKSNKKSKKHHDFTIASKDTDGMNIAVSVVIDNDKVSLNNVCNFILGKRMTDRNIKNGFIVKMIGLRNGYRVIEIEKYATNFA